jgi:hypothetical protein
LVVHWALNIEVRRSLYLIQILRRLGHWQELLQSWNRVRGERGNMLFEGEVFVKDNTKIMYRVVALIKPTGKNCASRRG